MNDKEKSMALTEMEVDAIGEIGNISMSSAATVLHDILQRKVTITTPKVSITSMKELAEKYTIPYVVVNVSYTKGITGTNLLVIKTEDVKFITSVMMGEESADYDKDLTELEISAIGEAMNQMMGTSATSMSTLINKVINISPPTVRIINISEDKENLPFQDDPVIVVVFKMQIENSLDTEIVLLMPYDFGKELVAGFLEKNDVDSEDGILVQKQEPAPEEKEETQSEGTDKSIKAATFQPFDESTAYDKDADNINMLMDVPLMLSVELARTKKSLKDILELNLGSIVSLDKPAGELVEVLVNGKLIARGEVVVIDDNFGVRITDIIGQDKHVKGTA